MKKSNLGQSYALLAQAMDQALHSRMTALEVLNPDLNDKQMSRQLTIH